VDDPIDRAEDLIAGDNYAAALEVLDEVAGERANDSYVHRLRAMALLVEGKHDEGFAAIRQAVETNPNNRRPYGRTLLDAAGVIIREKDRCAEAARLLDSSLALDPGLAEQALAITWQRGLEYMNSSGDSGYRLIQFAARHDQRIVARLQAKDPVLGRRYSEMRRIDGILSSLANAADRFHARTGRYPVSLDELTENDPMAGANVHREDWQFELSTDRDGRLRLTAEALQRNPHGVPAGTVLMHP